MGRGGSAQQEAGRERLRYIQLKPDHPRRPRTIATGFRKEFNILQPGGSFVFEEIDKRIIEVVERLSGGQFDGGISVIADDTSDSSIEESEGLIRRGGAHTCHINIQFLLSKSEQQRRIVQSITKQFSPI